MESFRSIIKRKNRQQAKWEFYKYQSAKLQSQASKQKVKKTLYLLSYKKDS